MFRLGFGLGGVFGFLYGASMPLCVAQAAPAWHAVAFAGFWSVVMLAITRPWSED